MIKKSVVAASVGLVGSANAFWRMECPGRVGLARMDPIVDPGIISTHVHAIHGSSGFGMNADTASLLAGDCTSCRVTQDMSSYWHPAMYFKDADTGEFEVVEQVGGMLAYYLLNGENITAFPNDFEMLAGNTKRRVFTAGDPSQMDPEKSSWSALGQTDQESLEQRALGFNCLNYQRDPEGTLYRHYMPDKEYLDANCANGLRLEIMFPSCWDGQNVNSDNHKDHVAYPDLVMNGNCPDSHPVRLPGLLYETIWGTQDFNGRNGMFVLANGDPTGFGYHADFIMGWDVDFLQEAVDTCTNQSGRIEDCPIFDVVDEATAKDCEFKMPLELMAEKVLEALNLLPGDVEITYGEDSDAEEEEEEPKPKPTLSYSPGDTPQDPNSPLPGQVFKETSAYVAPVPTTTSAAVAIAAVESSSEPEPEPTTTAPPPPPPEPVEPEPSFPSTQFITNGNVVSKIYWAEETVWVTELVGSTTTLTVEGAEPPAPTDDVDVEPVVKRHAHHHLHPRGHGRHHHL